MDTAAFWGAHDEIHACGGGSAACVAGSIDQQGIRRLTQIGMYPNGATGGAETLHAIEFLIVPNWMYEMIAAPGQRSMSSRRHPSGNACTHSPEQTLVSNTTVDSGALSYPCDMEKAASRPRSKHPHSSSTSGSTVDKVLLKLPRTGVVLLAVAALAGCATPPAKNFSGPWKPVNHFQSAPTEIPLNPAYVFYASPMDETLKTMLARWAKDSGRDLSYRLPFDVTLYQPVANIHTTDIDDAMAQLNTIYSMQGVFVTAGPRKIEVGPVVHSGGDASPAPAPPAAPPPATPAGTK